MKSAAWIICLLAAGLVVFRMIPGIASTEAKALPPPSVDEQSHVAGPETAVFAGGCFWGVQGVFQHVNGVRNAVSGYSGGEQGTAQYETVSTGDTGHAESVEVTYDPSIVTYGQLLQIYFSVVADPTTLNRQGPDHGTQYRSALFYQNDEQKKIGESYIAQLQAGNVFDRPIVTSLEPFKAFYPAEEYHQDFLSHNPDYPYIAINDMPKVRNLQQFFPTEYRQQPVLSSTQKG